jgi:hypothetical protein
MCADDDRLICTVCGREIESSEPVVQTEEGGIAHVRCVQREQRPPAVLRRRAVV